MNIRTRHNLPLCVMLLFCSGTALAQNTAEQIKSKLEQPRPEVDGIELLTLEYLREAYQGHEYQPFWNDANDVSELLALLEDSTAHGLVPSDYGVSTLLRLRAEKEQAEFDLLMTEALIRYGYHRRFGKVKGSSLDPDINFIREMFRRQPPAIVLRQALEADSLLEFIEEGVPGGVVYEGLKTYLAQYREVAASGGWPQIPDQGTLRRGDEDSRVPALRHRLSLTGDLARGHGAGSAFGDDLHQAVIAFQNRHALDADGIVGRKTFEALNVPVEQRIDQIRMSLERLRWISQETDHRIIYVNIAGFRVYYVEGDDIKWITRAMVGKHYRQTPVFRGELAYMEFNPTWTIPPGILRNDTLPAIKRDPGYLASKNIRVLDQQGNTIDPATVDWNQYSRGVPYILRQDPGPNNALGRVKFIFPNNHFVFLHDTPHRELFDHRSRAFSSGCIRVEDPLKLAELLLDDAQTYDRAAVEAIIESRKTQRLKTPDTVPVVISYLTAMLDRDGKLRLLDDIYDRDAPVLKALNGPVTIDAPAR